MMPLKWMLGILCFLLLEGGAYADDPHWKINGVAAQAYEGVARDDEGRSVLFPDVERTAALRRVHQFRSFLYHGKKDEIVTVKVHSVQFAPEVFISAGGTDIAAELNRTGLHKVEVKQTFPEEGDYSIRVRAKGAGQGIFHIAVHPEPAPSEKPVEEGNVELSRPGMPFK